MSANRIRVLLVSMLAVFAISAVASASASAHAFKVNGVVVAGATTFPIVDLSSAGVGGTGFAILEAPSVGLTIECQESVSNGKIEKEGKNTDEIKFQKCTKVIPATCKVGEPINTGTINSTLIGAAGKPVQIEFVPQVQPFANIVITGRALEGT
jgi:hypothetical protein